MAQTHTQKKAFEDQQNLIRGLLGRIRTHEFREEQRDDIKDFRVGMRRCFLTARAALNPSDFPEYLRWVTEQVRSQFPEYAKLKVGFGYISGHVAGPAVPLEIEISWIVARLNHEVEQLQLFRRFASSIDALVLRGDLDAAIVALDKVADEFGESLWSVQLRIAIEQQRGGLEAQKKFTERLRTKYRKSLLSFVTHHTSVRNEDRSSLVRFAEDIKSRMARSDLLSSELKTYIGYRLNRVWPFDRLAISEVLRVEQSHSIIDIYETLVSLLLESIRQPAMLPLRSLLRNALESLSPLDDFRLTKAALALGGSAPTRTLVFRSTAALDALVVGQIAKAAKLCRAEVREAVADPWQLIYQAFALAHRRHIPQPPKTGSLSFISLLAGIFGRAEGTADRLAQLEKLATNFAGLPFSVGLLDFLRGLRRIEEVGNLSFALVNLSSPTIGPEDLAVESGTRRSELISSAQERWKTHGASFWEALNSDNNAIGSLQQVSDLAAGSKFSAASDWEAASEALKGAVETSPSNPLRYLIGSVYAAALNQSGKRTELIEFLARECARNEECRYLLPVVTAGADCWHLGL